MSMGGTVIGGVVGRTCLCGRGGGGERWKGISANVIRAWRGGPTNPEELSRTVQGVSVCKEGAGALQLDPP